EHRGQRCVVDTHHAESGAHHTRFDHTWCDHSGFDDSGFDRRDHAHHHTVEQDHEHAHHMKAVVLVGGEGTRLRPLTYGVPKPLLPIANVPFLERQLTWLASHGIDEVILSLGYLPDAFKEHFPNDRFGDVRLRYAIEEKPLGTAGGIRFAADGID